MATPGGKTWEKCIVWLLLCHTMECEPSHYVVWQKANHRNRHFPMIRENALIPALPHQPKNRRKSCGVVHGQPEPDSWNQAAPGPITMAWWWSLCWRSFCPYRLWSRSASWTADSTSVGRPLACAAPASDRRSAVPSDPGAVCALEVSVFCCFWSCALMRSVSVAETDALVSITFLTCGSSNADHAAASANLASAFCWSALSVDRSASSLEAAFRLPFSCEVASSNAVTAMRFAPADARAQAGHRDDADQDARP